MAGKFRVLAAAFACLALTGCLTPKSFVDPSFPKVTYEDLKRRPEPLRLKVDVEFQRMGERFLRAETLLKDNTERILRASGIIVPAADQGEGAIRVVVNNTGDVGEARAKGFGTGLTFGAVGNTVTDRYEMSVTIVASGKTVTKTGIKHAIHTAIGNTETPPGLEVMLPNVAFERALEQMLLRALQEMQQNGDLAALLPARTRGSVPSFDDERPRSFAQHELLYLAGRVLR